MGVLLGPLSGRWHDVWNENVFSFQLPDVGRDVNDDQGEP